MTKWKVRRAAARSAIHKRWRGEVPLAKAFWLEMTMVGTAVNVATGAAALIAVALDAPLWLAACVFFAPLPYNALLVVSVWRAALRDPRSWSGLARACAVVWFGVVLLI